MATKTKVEKPPTEVATVPPRKELVLEGDPQAQLDFAMKAANALMRAVGQKPKKVMIRGEQYLEYGDWQTLARFFGATASVAWSKKLADDNGIFLGYEARAEVLHNGMVISSAEAMCMKAEKNWNARDEFMLRSMAQTRASAKALRNAYGWVAELAGMKSTPAEEMGDMYDQTPIKADAVPTVTYDEQEDNSPQYPNNPVAKYIDKGKTELQKKKEIMQLCESITLHPLDKTAEAYQNYVFSQTGLLLTPEHYDEIITKLTAIKAGEK